MNKKLLLSFAAIGSMAAPITSLVACGQSGLNFDASKKDSLVMIVGNSGHDDKGFLQGAYDGSMEAKKSISEFKNYGEIKIPDSKIPTSKEGTQKSLQAGAYAILGVGFQYPTFFNNKDYAKKYPDREFIGIDGSVVDSTFQPTKPEKNVTTVAFKSEQSGFLTGVATGLYLTKNYSDYNAGGLKVGAFGGANYSSVTDIISGYIHGIAYYNDNLAKDAAHKITFIGWSGQGNGMTGGFVPDSTSTTKSNTLLSKGADIVFPVAGGQVNSMVDAIKNKNGSKTKIVGVDSDQSKVFGEDGKYFITSALKDTKIAALESIKAIYGDTKALVKKGANNVKGLKDGFVGMAEGVFSGYKGSDFNNLLKTSQNIIATNNANTIFSQINDANNAIYTTALSASKDWTKASVIFGATKSKEPAMSDF